MPEVIRCANEGRLQALRDQNVLNGIDFMVVIDAAGDVPDELRQRLLMVRMVLPLTDDALNSPVGSETPTVSISGGVRVPRPRVRWVHRLQGLDADTIDTELGAAERAFIGSLVAQATDPTFWLLVMVEEYGDHSLYELSLRDGVAPPANFDRLLSTIEFSFKVECPSPFDCLRETVCPPEPEVSPELDYLSRDFTSFRRLMFDRLALIAPADGNREVAPLRSALVEVLAYEADRLAYFQDAVATEAYLHTARTRPSVKRHARLLGYPMHEGTNARAFVRLEVQAGAPIPNPMQHRTALAPGAKFVTRLRTGGAVLSQAQFDEGQAESPETYEVLVGPGAVSQDNNSIDFYTWGDGDCCIPAGATQTWIVDSAGLSLEAGDFLLLEQTVDPNTLQPADADPAARHVVRLTDVGDAEPDLLFPGTSVRSVSWHDEDALPFPLVVSVGEAAVAAAAGNMVLVDHGRSIIDEVISIQEWGNQGGLRAQLGREGLTWSHEVSQQEGAELSAASLLEQDARQAAPQVRLQGEEERWTAVRDLLRSTAQAREFVVEMEQDGTARLRFGDNVLGRRPSDSSVGLSELPDAVDQTDEQFLATYRVGTGESGNVGAGAIAHLVNEAGLVDASMASALVAVDNPLPAVGGVRPETLAEIRRDAPQAFRIQERAVTVEDWVEVTERNPEVQRALAKLQWTGSWHTVFVTVDPIAGIDFADLRDDLERDLDRYRLAGYDLEIVAPAYVPLDIALTVCIEPYAYQDQVELALREEFSVRLLADRRRGFFHPDNFTFGDSVWLSQVVARCMSVSGVRYVEADSTSNPTRFKRRGRAQTSEIDDGRIRLDAFEIARCDSDPNNPEMGSIDFFIEGAT